VTDRIVEPLKKWIKEYNLQELWADVPGQLQVDLRAMFNVGVGLPPKNDWVAGVNTMAAKFAMNKVRIDKENCPFLYRSIMGGTFNKHRTDFERSSALGHCDALAAMLYSIRVLNHADDFGRNYSPSETILPQEIKESMAPPVFGTFKDRRKNYGKGYHISTF
jgi:hypothetical protein